MAAVQKSAGPRPVAAPVQPLLTGRSFLADITVEHGPPGLLGRYFLAADQASRARGIRITFGTYEELMEVNAKNLASWWPMVSMYNLRDCPKGLSPDRAFCLFGTNADGDVVATQCGRIYALAATSLYDELTSLRAFYDDPTPAMARGEACTVSAKIARELRGRILLGGGAWYRPDFRGRGLATIFPRISRAYALTRWDTDWTTSLFAEEVVNGGVMKSSGYSKGEWDMRLLVPDTHDRRGCVAWMDRAELLADLETEIVRLAPAADAGRVDRRA